MTYGNLQKFKKKDNCWICEGWNEVKIDYRSKILGAEIYVHFDFDDYKPDLLLTVNAGHY